jgi:hypothetical protein
VAHLQRSKLVGVGPGLCGLPRIPYFGQLGEWAEFTPLEIRGPED